MLLKQKWPCQLMLNTSNASLQRSKTPQTSVLDIIISNLMVLFTNPSARVGYGTRSIFKRSLTGFNSEFSFSLNSCLTKAEEPSLSYYLPIDGERIIGFIPSLRVLVLCEIQFDGELPVMLEFWRMRSLHLLPLLPDPLWLAVGAPDRVQSMDQIELKCELIRGALNKLPDFFCMFGFSFPSTRLVSALKQKNPVCSPNNS